MENNLDLVKIAEEFLAMQKGLSPNEKKEFLEICKAFNLNPYKREIYPLVYGSGIYRTCSIVIGYEVFLKRAYSEQNLAGWKVWTEGSVQDNSLKAIIEIHRKDWSFPFTHEVEYSEYVSKAKIDGVIKPNKMWATKPKTMIKKVAMGQGFRLCFPERLGGIPYLEEEIETKIQEREEIKMPIPKAKKEVKEVKEEIVDALIVSQELRPEEDEDFKDIFSKIEEDIEASRKEIFKL